VTGRVDIAPIPRGPNGSSVSLNVYWILSIAKGAVHPEIAWRFLRHCASKEMDKLLTLEGAIGCRKSTWADDDVNRTVPFYHKLAELHGNAREMPRLAGWQSIAAVIDEAVIAALDSDIPSRQLLQEAQGKIDARS
jgi:multiple sugar transport system substrate-binding protein